MHQILVLWATCRSRSTAFERMIFERGDFKVLHEPFGRYYYFSDERKNNRASKVEPRPEYAFEAILNNIFSLSQTQNIFIKEQAFQAESKITPEILTKLTNTFILRHPEEVIPSMFNKMPDFTLEELGYQALEKIFQQCAEITGEPPVLIDSNDLIINPHACIERYCEAVNISFIPEALNWNSTLPKEFIWWEGGSWLDEVSASNNFKKTQNDYVKIEDQDELKQAYDDSMPYYSAMLKYKLKID